MKSTAGTFNTNQPEPTAHSLRQQLSNRSSHAGHTHGNNSSLTQRQHLTVHGFCSSFAITASTAERAASRAAATLLKSTPGHFYPSLIFVNLLPSLKRFQNLGICCNCNFMLEGEIKQLRATLARWSLAIRRIQLGLRVPHCKEFLDMSCFVHGHLCVCACTRWMHCLQWKQLI